MAQQKLDKSELNILGHLVFPEPFNKIMEETGQQSGELRDNLINLLNFGLVEAFEKESRVSSSAFYDVDNLQDFSFVATRKGLAAI
jgi:hypothetical protein